MPKGGVDREALIRTSPNIKSRFTQNFGFGRLKVKFSKLALVAISVLFLNGYVPLTNSRTISYAAASTELEQKDQIISQNLPVGFKLPFPGYISTRFSFYHPGVDLATGLGMPIHPVADGVVDQTNFGFFGYGNHVVIKHQGGYQSLYAHMGRIFVRVGQSVTTDNIIGEVGLTGNTSGPHTHLEISKNGQNLDPLSILPPISAYPKAEYLTPYQNSAKLKADSNLHKELKPQF